MLGRRCLRRHELWVRREGQRFTEDLKPREKQKRYKLCDSSLGQGQALNKKSVISADILVAVINFGSYFLLKLLKFVTGQSPRQELRTPLHQFPHKPLDLLHSHLFVALSRQTHGVGAMCTQTCIQWFLTVWFIPQTAASICFPTLSMWWSPLSPRASLRTPRFPRL